MEEDNEMARKPKADQAQSPAPYGNSTPRVSERVQFAFINVHFNANDQDWLCANESEADSTILEFISGLVDGYKLSVSFDKQSTRFNATLACSLVGDDNYGLILSSRGADAIAALFGLAYADLHKLEGQWRRLNNLPGSRFG